MGTCKSEIHRAGWQYGNSGSSWGNVEVKMQRAGWTFKYGFYAAVLRPNPFFF